MSIQCLSCKYYVSLICCDCNFHSYELGGNKMPIGNGPDCYDGINREEDRMIKLVDEVQEWWDNLEYQVQFELMDIEYPDHAHLLDLEGMWEGLDWEIKLDIWRRENGYE